MKKYLVIFSLLTASACCTTTRYVSTLEERTSWRDSLDNIRLTRELERLNEKDWEWDLLWEAVAIEESQQNPLAKNPYSSASGYYQLLRGYVAEANQILGYDKYSYNDRFSKEKSREMIEVVQSYYNPKKDIKKAIRLHRVGFSTTLEDPLAKYKRKVLNNLDSLKQSWKEK